MFLERLLFWFWFGFFWEGNCGWGTGRGVLWENIQAATFRFYLSFTDGGFLFCAVHPEIRIWCLTAMMVFFWYLLCIIFLLGGLYLTISISFLLYTLRLKHPHVEVTLSVGVW